MLFICWTLLKLFPHVYSHMDSKIGKAIPSIETTSLLHRLAATRAK